MLHGVFVKKIPRESTYVYTRMDSIIFSFGRPYKPPPPQMILTFASFPEIHTPTFPGRSHAHLLQCSSSPPSQERAPKAASHGNHIKRQEEAAASTSGAQKRRVSFAPVLSGAAMSPDCVITKIGIPSSEQDKELRDDVRELEQTVTQSKEVIADKAVEMQEDKQVSTSGSSVLTTAQLSHRIQPLPLTSPGKDNDTSFSPGSEISEEGSTASSLSSSASFYELPHPAKQGRGRRGRPRGRTKRGSRGRGGMSVEVMEGAEGAEGGEEEVIVRGRGGRGRKKRGRGSRYMYTYMYNVM